MPECKKCPIQEECKCLKEFEERLKDTTGRPKREKVSCYLTLAIGKALLG